MKFKDYYEVMGVARDAPQDEIRRAYRRLARKYHPDVSKESEAEARFKELGEAYEVLKDPEKRAAYDRLGANWKAGEDFRPPPDWDAGFEFSGGGFTGADDRNFSDFFESLFKGNVHSGRGRGPFHAPGQDRHARILIDLEDSFRGATRTITLQTPELDANGRPVARERSLRVRIPPGICPGQHIRLAGQGSPGSGQAPAGDLYLEIDFRPHPRFRVEGRDLYVDLPVAPWEAASGATVAIDTPGGAVDLKIPAGVAGGQQLRLRGRGLPASPPGDLYAVIRIMLPPAHTEEQQAFYRKMAEQFAGFDPRKEMGAKS